MNRFLKTAIIAFAMTCALSLYSCTKEADTGFDAFGLCAPDNLGGFSLNQVTRTDSVDYPEMALVLKTIHKDCIGGIVEDENSFIVGYLEERVKNIKQFAENDPDFMSGYYAPIYYDAGILSDVKVSADATIFGREAGEDISDHIVLAKVNKRNVLISSFPDLCFVGKAYEGMSIRDFLKVGTAVHGSREIVFTFDAFPDDMPDSFQLTFEIPVELNDSWGELPQMWKSPEYQTPASTCVYKVSAQIVNPRK